MSIMPDTERVLGFEDHGDGQESSKIADHVLVFMLLGIKKKFKQPLAYTFCDYQTKSPDLIRTIKEIIREIRKAGQYVTKGLPTNLQLRN
jgi:hypothetical protein